MRPAALAGAAAETRAAAAPIRRRLRVRGMVQGVGYRPYVYRLAVGLGLDGWVANRGDGVAIEVQGQPAQVAAFEAALGAHPVMAALPLGSGPAMAGEEVPQQATEGFHIAPSQCVGSGAPPMAPDLATCPDCLRELHDPADRRHRYPFIACAHCGPRYSVLELLPYDRERTALRGFPLCAACRTEYGDPADRRFHAEAMVCPACGPRLALWDAAGAPHAADDAALAGAVALLRRGGILALKGLGGFHLLVDARDAAAVSRLRERKAREAKPLAVMFPDGAALEAACRVSPEEVAWLTSPVAPVVLLARRDDAPDAVCAAVAPENPYLGAMLPYTPLHHLLLADFGGPLVATSGNRSEEPLCADEAEALERLGGIADGFLVHDRPILRPVDDSVLAVLPDGPLVLRRARGFVPLPAATLPTPEPVLAVGGHLKNTAALAAHGVITLSPHVGDLDTEPSRARLAREAEALRALHGVAPAAIAADTHPDYAATAFALELGPPVTPVGHHLAHACSVMAEHGLAGPVLAVSWDGTGHGGDGTVWGGEFLRVADGEGRRLAHLRHFPLPGGERAVREPRRAALGLLHALHGEALWADPPPQVLPPALRAAFDEAEWCGLRRMLERGLNCPLTSSAGRLFDAVAALLGLRMRSRFEGEAAMAVEFAAARAGHDEAGADGADEETAGLAICDGDPLVLDWEPAFRRLLDPAGGSPEARAARFHLELAAGIVALARQVGEPVVVLGGGCFQNRRLLGLTQDGLRRAGFRVYRPRWVPPNDGGLALGQAAAVLARRSKE